MLTVANGHLLQFAFFKSKHSAWLAGDCMLSGEDPSQMPCMMLTASCYHHCDDLFSYKRRRLQLEVEHQHPEDTIASHNWSTTTATLLVEHLRHEHCSVYLATR